MDSHGHEQNPSVFFHVFPWRAIRVSPRLLAVLAVALGLRLFGLRYGLPAVYNPDEVAIMSRALAFAKGDLNPHNFLYPTLYFYVLFAWEGLTAVLAVATRAVASFGAFQREFFVDPTRVYVAGRLLTALAGTATLAATFALARRLAGPLAAITAAVAVAVAPLHVRDSHYVKHDVPVTLLVVLAYLAYAKLWDEKRGLVWAAIVTGLAFATHYYAIFLALPLAWSAARGAATASDASPADRSRGAHQRRRLLPLLPFILVEPGVALRDIQANRQIVIDRAVGSLGYGATLARYAQMLLWDTVGWPLVAAAAIGTALLAARDTTRALWLFAFPVPFFIFIASTYPASRYLIPLVPFVAILAGVAIARLGELRRLDAWAALGALAVLPFIDSLRTDAFIRQTDTRTLARDFVDAHVPAGATILTQPYSVPLEPTADALREAVARSGRELPAKTRFEIERSPYPEHAYRLIYLGRGLDADKLYLPQEELAADPLGRLRSEHVAFVVLKRYNDEGSCNVFAADGRAGPGRPAARRVFAVPGRHGRAARALPAQHGCADRDSARALWTDRGDLATEWPWFVNCATDWRPARVRCLWRGTPGRAIANASTRTASSASSRTAPAAPIACRWAPSTKRRCGATCTASSATWAISSTSRANGGRS